MQFPSFKWRNGSQNWNVLEKLSGTSSFWKFWLFGQSHPWSRPFPFCFCFCFCFLFFLFFFCVLFYFILFFFCRLFESRSRWMGQTGSDLDRWVKLVEDDIIHWGCVSEYSAWECVARRNTSILLEAHESVCNWGCEQSRRSLWACVETHPWSYLCKIEGQSRRSLWACGHTWECVFAPVRLNFLRLCRSYSTGWTGMLSFLKWCLDLHRFKWENGGSLLDLWPFVLFLRWPF